MADFKNFIPKEAKIKRDESETFTKIEAKMLVPGDIVFIEMGDNIPADIILF